MEGRLPGDDLSRLVLDAIASQQVLEYRLAAELVIYLAVRQRCSLQAIVYETLAQDLRAVLQPAAGNPEIPDSILRERCKKAATIASGLRSKHDPTVQELYFSNLLMALIGKTNFENATPHQVGAFFERLWQQFLTVPQEASNDQR
jgi:hypothetical protein